MNRRSREDNGDNGGYAAPAQDNFSGNNPYQGGYQQNGFQSHNQNSYAPMQDSYRQSAPPMPEANYGNPGGAAPMPEDDIPF